MICRKCGSNIDDNAPVCPICGEPSGIAADNVPMPEAAGMPAYNMSTPETSGMTPEAATAGIKKTPVIIGIIAAALIAVLSIINIERINNFIHKTFSSPEKYYQFVEHRKLKESVKKSGEAYGSYKSGLADLYDKSTETEFTIVLEEDGKALRELLEYAGFDVSWFQSASISTNASFKDNTAAERIALSINDTALLSVNVIMDNGIYYTRIPEISETYIGVDTSTQINGFPYRNTRLYGYAVSDALSPESIQTSYRNLADAYPDRKQLEELISRYMNLVIDCINNVSKSNTTLSVEGVSQKCTMLKVTIDSGSLQNIAETVLVEMQNDDELQTLIINMLSANEDAAGDEAYTDELYNEFQEFLEYLINELDYLSYMDEDMIMNVYVDGKGNIIGRTISFYDLAFSKLTPEKGGKNGYELSYKYDNDSIRLAGTGTRSGGTLNGNYSMEVNDIPVIDIIVNNLTGQNNGRLNGRLEIMPSAEVSRIVSKIPKLSFIGYSTLILDFGSASDSNTFKMSLTTTKYDIGSISISSKTGNASVPAIPDSNDIIMIEDEDDIIEWVEGIDLDNLISAMKSAGIPAGFIDELEELNDTLKDDVIDDLKPAMH